MIDQLVSFVIRPPRAEYTPEEDLLGPIFTIKGRRYQRYDLELVNLRGHTLQCSHYMPVNQSKDELLPCVIYCHGNSGCRADANEAAVMLLPSNITVFALDFAGSGMSGGEYVTLGQYEMQDVATAVDHLRVEGRTSLIGLWGRSMGAVTALLYGATDPSIAGMVLDSPFSNLNGLIMELVDVYKIRLPKFGVKLAVHYMRRVIRQKANFDIQELDSLMVAPRTFIPALFGHAEGDVFIQPHHSNDIYAVYSGDKNIIKFPGDHNSPRPSFYFDSVAIFFHNVLQPPEIDKTLTVLEEGEGDNFLRGNQTSRNHISGSLGFDLGDEDIDQETLYELLGTMGISDQEEEKSSSSPKQPVLEKTRHCFGKERLVQSGDMNGDTEDLLDSALPHRQISATIVPPLGEEDTEEQKADEVARILGTELSQASQPKDPSFPDIVFPSTEQDEEKMLMEAIALSLQEPKEDSKDDISSSSAPTTLISSPKGKEIDCDNS